jgi:hypothetical protein
VQQSPADRSEDPLAQEEGRPDDGKERRDHDRPNRDATEGRRQLDRVADLLELGPGELDVRAEEPLCGVAGRADLLAQPGRRGWARALAGSARGCRLLAVRLRVGRWRVAEGRLGSRLRIVQGIGLRWAARRLVSGR